MDTSVFCNIVNVPGRNQQMTHVLKTLKELIRQRTSLLLPLVVILETGNHIGQLAAGGLRRQAAERFNLQVEAALDGRAPWKPTPFMEAQQLRTWLGEFPDHAGRGRGLGDLFIIKEWERQRQLNPARRVFIWAFDQHLDAYDTGTGKTA